METLFIVARVILAMYFLMSALNHFTKKGALSGYASARGLPMPGVGVVVTGMLLLFGGLGLLLGVYTAVAIWLLVIFLVAAAFGIHHFWTDTDPNQRMSEMTNFMKNIALAAALLMLLFIPTPWVFSLI